MINMIKNKFSSMDLKVKKLLKYGMFFSLLVCVLALILLVTYHFSLNIDLYYIGLAIFKLGLFFAVEFLICAFAIDTIKKQVDI